MLVRSMCFSQHLVLAMPYDQVSLAENITVTIMYVA